MAKNTEAHEPNELRRTVCKTAAFGSVFGCVVYVGSRVPVSVEDWSAYLTFLAPFLSREHATPRVVWDDSGGPTPLGRQKLAALTQGCPVKVAFVTDAGAGRNVATALNWNRQEQSYRAFSAKQLDEAIAFVGVSGEQAASVRAALLTLRGTFGL